MAVVPPPSRRRKRRLDKVLEIVNIPLDWLEERSGLVGGVKYFLFRKVPSDMNWWHTLGSATLTAFLVQAGTGVILAMYYHPHPDTAYESVRHMTHDVTLGWLVRGMHRWGASVFIILLFLHMGRVFLFGAYKYPRELNWIVGVLILPLAMLEGFTGYLAAVGSDRLLGDGRRHQPERDRALRRTAPRPVLTWRRRDRRGDADALLRDAHAALTGSDHGPDRAAPLSRGAAGRELAAVVPGGRGTGTDGAGLFRRVRSRPAEPARREAAR